MNVWQRFVAWLAKVSAVPVSRDDDGLVPAFSAGNDLDKDWGKLSKEFSDALEAWRSNPLARRIIGLITSYVVADGITLSSDYRPLARYIRRFVAHPKNRLMLRQAEMCAELSRSGELFPVLFLNPADGMSYLRLMPASRIDRIEWKPGDYETELQYHEVGSYEKPDGTWWKGAAHPDIWRVVDDPEPVMLHYAVNRPVGALRGESDLAPILLWLQRYSKWLEDRVRLNAGTHVFLWDVTVPSGMVKAKREQYRTPPRSGSLIIHDEAEQWKPISPMLHANDAANDGRALRWMIAAGGPGIGLVDFGESETANLATAKAMSEQRWRFLTRRQAYFGFVLADIVVTAYNRAVAFGLVRGRRATIEDVRVGLPDISPSDNRELAIAARAMVETLTDLRKLGITGDDFRRYALRLVMKFAGETLSDEDLEKLLKESAIQRVSEATSQQDNESARQRVSGELPELVRLGANGAHS
ncbi:MAG: hypothetical protein GXP39_06945 [Chloroflexi bacterium]|nr:hypothetical protein [Chloroflexota bacterium]